MKRTMILALVLVAALLTATVGGTIAWFTDEVTSANNVIQSGTLEVKVEYKDGETWKDLEENPAPLFNSTLWEPGRAEVRGLRIANTGTLALKYQLNFELTAENTGAYKLEDVIDVYLFNAAPADRSAFVDTAKVGTLADLLYTEDTDGAVHGKLAAGASSGEIYVGLKMREEAGNDYQGLSVGEGFGLTLVATQDTVESDSFGSDYDAQAPHIEPDVTTTEELMAALKNPSDGEVIYLAAGTYDGLSFVNPSSYAAKNITLVGLDDVVVNGISFHGETGEDKWNIDVDGLTLKNITFSSGLLFGAVSHKNIVVEDCDFINNACIHQNNGAESISDLTVRNCSFTGNGEGTVTALMLENASNVTVEGCTFTDIQYNVLQGSLSGTNVFDNNKINCTGDRVFRFVSVSGDTTISNNTIVSEGDDSGELAKASNPCTITLTNNTWNGETDAEASDKLINITAK